MPNLNRVMLMGNLTRDPELRYTPNNTAVANLGLAVNRRWKNQAGEQQEETTFVDCEAWGRTAEVLNQYLQKGRPVYLEGRLKLDQWQDKDGQNRSKLKVVVEQFQFIDSKPGAPAAAATIPGVPGAAVVVTTTVALRSPAMFPPPPTTPPATPTNRLKKATSRFKFSDLAIW